VHCGIGSCWLLLRSASESGRLRHGYGDSEGGKRCRRGGPSVDYPFPSGLLVLATGCSEGLPDKQWYKPNVNYTTADFERDRTACTDKKTKVLDEDCMKDRGWVAFGGDIGPAVKAPEPSAGRTKGKY
jgi:hypothetical protein